MGGDADLCKAFERVRGETLARPRDAAALHADILQMRARMRGELDRSGPDGFDLKQGEGGLVDLEFLLQALVLGHAAARPALLSPRATPVLIEAVESEGVVEAADADRLRDAHATLLARGLECTLDRRSRRVPLDDGIEAARAAIREVARNHELDFPAGLRGD